MARYSGVNWVATLASQAPQFVLPLVVAQSVASSTYANFFLAWTVTGLVFLVPGAIAQVLLVEGAKDATGRRDHEPVATGRAREALAFSLGLATVAWLGSIVVGQVVAAVFGDRATTGWRLLPALMAAGIPWSITAVRLSEARIRRDQVATVAITMTLGLGILVPTVLFVPSGGTGAPWRPGARQRRRRPRWPWCCHQRWRRSGALVVASTCSDGACTGEVVGPGRAGSTPPSSTASMWPRPADVVELAVRRPAGQVRPRTARRRSARHRRRPPAPRGCSRRPPPSAGRWLGR